MNDMSQVIVPKSDQINADDLLAGPRTITIERVSIRPGTEQPVSIHFESDNGKPYKPCKSMARVMVHLWGADANNYVGRSMTLYCDPKVLWGGMAVGGIRISHMSHINEAATMALTATKGKRTPYTVRPLAMEQKATTPAPTDFLGRVRAKLATITNEDALHAFVATKAIREALADAPDDVKDALNAALAEARERLEVPHDPATGARLAEV